MRYLLLIFLLLHSVVAFAADPQPEDITCSQGEDRSKILVLKASGQPMDLTGYSFRAQLRAGFTDVTPLAELTIDNSGAGEGQLIIMLPAALTAQLAGRTGVWDLKETDPSGMASYPVRGKFKVYWSATR
jgi:hypothetical protein